MSAVDAPGFAANPPGSGNGPDQASLPWRLRSDLEVHPAGDGNADSWTIKDPLRLSYFRVDSVELQFLRLLDGQTSLGAIRAELDSRFPESVFDISNLRMFLVTAIHSGLVVACVPGFSSRIAQRNRRTGAAALPRRVMALLSWRFRGIDPTPILDRLHRLLGPLLDRRLLPGVALLCGAALMMVFARQTRLESELPGIAALFTATNLPWLMLAVVFVKILHELGHGLVCRHFGGECHELGVLFVGFLPLLYCDVSDSWLQQDRRKRMAVVAAGIGTELLLAAVCAVLWCLTRNGWLHTFLLNVMLICSLNTLLVNGNPLLKYDGYYVMSDWLNIPNLAGESSAAAVSLFDRVVLGLPGWAGSVRSGATRVLMSLWGVACIAYRSVMLVTLLWVMHHTFKTLKLEFLTIILAASMAISLGIGLLRGVTSRWREVIVTPASRRRSATGLSLLAVLVLVVLFVPMPCSVNAPFVLTPGVCRTIYVPEDGQIHALVRAGQHVEAGGKIASLDNAFLDFDAARAEGEFTLARTRLAALMARRFEDPQAGSEIPGAEEDLVSRQANFEMLRRKQQALTIVSPVSGTVYFPRNRPLSRGPAGNELSFWSGQPLAAENESAWLGRSTVLCHVGSPDEFRAVCLLAQQDIDLVAERAAVTLTYASAPGRPAEGHVTERRTMPEQSVERELIRNHLVAVADMAGMRPNETLFGVAVAMDSAGIPPLYVTGHASIRCRPLSLARRFWRFLSHTFTFEA